ncbi:Na+/H+ antiporter subunit E [Guyparkeria hydrothermalis]|uniref:Na+/H+ antiporter subunit E n=1 Tax=Guyparkeria hydrothermalis TaxID=923 RepID=UPI00202013F9|nr:Na+/H+ antiporter subunit E [Guyparkeria hydrothermalis]MCL7744192.1 Na+/H+ antiporter subunit E [Guyparkeria hydrothermalis]
MRRFLPQPVLSLALLITWLVLNNSVAPGSIVMGAIVGLVVPWITHRFWEIGAGIKDFTALLGYMGVVLVDIIHANFVVARQVLGPNRALNSQLFELELDLQGALPISILAATITLTPGTVSCRVSADQRSLWVHALHADDRDEEILGIKQRYEARLQRIFGQPVTAGSNATSNPGAES